jgi:hypothetical protein
MRMENLTAGMGFRASRQGYIKVSRHWWRLSFVEDLGMHPVGHQGKQRHMIRCQCECGAIVDVPLNHLRRGTTKSCGCLAREMTAQRDRIRNLTHGASRFDAEDFRLFTIWSGAHDRCENPNSTSYYRYGGRGVFVCPQWAEFVPFRDWAKANRYRKDRSLDRYPDKHGPYAPWNCRWATRKQQSRNMDTNHLITWLGITPCVVEWGEDPRSPVGKNTILARLQRGWTEQDAVSVPPLPPEARRNALFKNRG